MGEKGNAVDLATATGTTHAGGQPLAAAANAAAAAHGESGESAMGLVGGIAAKTGGEFVAGAVLGAATEKVENRSKRRSGSKDAAGDGPED
jgi:hypothetical protein